MKQLQNFCFTFISTYASHFSVYLELSSAYSSVTEMEKPQSLADLLNVEDPRGAAEQHKLEPTEPTVDDLLDVTDPKQFCQKILETREFRRYIVNGIVIGDIPAAVLTRLMDHGWGVPPKRLEHTGPDGGPVVTEVRRVIVQAPSFAADMEAMHGDQKVKSKLTH